MEYKTRIFPHSEDFPGGISPLGTFPNLISGIFSSLGGFSGKNFTPWDIPKFDNWNGFLI